MTNLLNIPKTTKGQILFIINKAHKRMNGKIDINIDCLKDFHKTDNTEKIYELIDQVIFDSEYWV